MGLLSRSAIAADAKISHAARQHNTLADKDIILLTLRVLKSNCIQGMKRLWKQFSSGKNLRLKRLEKKTPGDDAKEVRVGNPRRNVRRPAW
jgi:hypothetical protein